METQEDEEKALRSTALQNANSVLLARRRAVEALERRTGELAQSLSVMRATLEATTDGILVTDQEGGVVDFNARFVQFWRLPPEILATRDYRKFLEHIAPQLADPAKYLAGLRKIPTGLPPESFHVLECADGRVLECHTRVSRIGERIVGRVWCLRDITARHRAEAELRQQHEWFRVTLASIGDAVITADTQANVTFLNPVAEAMTGWTLGEARGQPLGRLFNIVNELTRQPAVNPVGRVLQEGVTVGLANHTALIAKDGTERAIEDSAAPIRDEAGQVIGVVMVFHDVGERRKTERALRRSERLLTDFFDNAVVGLHWVGPDDRILRVNRSELDLLGYAEEEFVGHPIAEFHVDAPVIKEILRKLRCGETVENHEARLRCKDGSIRHVLISSNVLWEDGQFVHSRCFTRDITDLKRAEEARARLAAVVESSDDAIISKTLDGMISTWNGGAERMFGYSAAEVVGKPVTLLIPPELADEEPAILDRLKRGEHIDHYETVRRRKDGTLLDVSLTVSPVRDAQGTIIGASKIARDVTRRKQAEAALRASEARLYQAEQQARAAAEQAGRLKDDFLAALSHELRTPLTPVLAILSDLGGDPDIPAALAADLETARRNVELEVRLIDDLLDLTRIARGKLELHWESVTVGELIKRAVETCLPDLEARRLTLVREITNPQRPVRVDSARITQILWNLLRNSIKFTPEGGTITVRSHDGSAGGEGRAIIEVQDTGIGIEPEQLAKVFNAFEQGDRKITRQFGGLGLGLAISKAIAGAHHATLTAASEGAGRGSTFTLALPSGASVEDRMNCSPAKGPGDFPGTASPDSMVIPPLRILLVEDHADTAKSLSTLLARRGHLVTVAGDVAGALGFAATQRFDLLLTDLGLPDATGYDLMRQIRDRHSIPGIALSGYGMEEDVRHCQEAGFSGHLVKPVRISQLEEALSRFCLRR